MLNTKKFQSSNPLGYNNPTKKNLKCFTHLCKTSSKGGTFSLPHLNGLWLANFLSMLFVRTHMPIQSNKISSDQYYSVKHIHPTQCPTIALSAHSPTMESTGPLSAGYRPSYATESCKLQLMARLQVRHLLYQGFLRNSHCLGPLLFNLNINDIVPQTVKEGASIHLFADDCIVYMCIGRPVNLPRRSS